MKLQITTQNLNRDKLESVLDSIQTEADKLVSDDAILGGLEFIVQRHLDCKTYNYILRQEDGTSVSCAHLIGKG